MEFCEISCETDSQRQLNFNSVKSQGAMFDIIWIKKKEK